MNTTFQAGQNDVAFTSAGATLRGHLFLPPTFDPAQRVPAAVVAPTWTSVKEQMADLYACRLAEQGFAVLDFDFRFYGASDGEPRQFESPRHKIEDLGNAVTFLESLPFVDRDRIGGLGVCAGSGYIACTAANDQRIKALALAAPWLHNAALVEQIYGGAAGVQQRITAGNAARQRYEATGEVEMVPAASATDQNAAMYGDLDYYLNPARGGISQYPNQFAVMSWPEWLQFDPIRIAPDVRVPTLLVHSDGAAIPEGAREFYAGLTNPKDFFWTEGTQFDFYDQEPNLTKAVMAAATHFRLILS